LHSSDGEKDEAPSTQRIIIGTGFELSLQLYFIVYIVRCLTAHLAILTFSELGQKSSSLTTDLENSSRPPLLVMASGKDCGECPYGRSPHHTLPSH
jgi:hypothetical protein